MNEQELLSFIEQTSGDPKYQTVEIDDRIIKRGYSQCWISWDNILNTGISFSNKTVCDLGCFNGYFSIKAKKLGAKLVIGIDQNAAALSIARTVSEMNNIECEFINKIVGEPNLFDRQYDIIMALNMLHHVRAAKGENVHKQVINDIIVHSKEVIFEVNANEIAAVTACVAENDSDMTTHSSHRKTQFGDRSILYVKNNGR